ncbi:MAG: DUF4159 domain-containing protein [Gemmatimonadales bacterium]|nr:MAG: DUF4159 domain-containing protein [Gemmatimonadales bacterium]
MVRGQKCEVRPGAGPGRAGRKAGRRMEERLRGRITTVAALWALCLGLAAACADEADNWGALLGSEEVRAAAPAGILGMSADDLQNYSEAEEALADEEVPDDFIQGRRRFVLREMMFNAGWTTAPTAVPAFVEQLKRRTGMKALALSPRKAMTFASPELTDWPFIFMTAHNAFSLSEAEQKGLRTYLLRGGFLYIDDCLYGFPFGQAVPGELQRALPEAEFKRLEPKQPVYGVILKQKYGWDKTNEAGLPGVMRPNFWQYIEIGGHMAVLYTPQDIGCLWEISSPPTPSNPLGAGMHSQDRVPGLREAAYELGVNIVIYSMTH